jgi:hypothetical protein
MEVRNTQLHYKLQVLFGDVRVANAGEERLVVDKVYRHGGQEITLTETVRAGEEYFIDCPFCNDTRKRLAVNHNYGVWDEERESWNEHLLYCFNEGCHKDYNNRHHFYTRVMVCAFHLRRPNAGFQTAAQGRGHSFGLHQRKESVESLYPARLPQNLVPVNQLHPDHPAAVYLRKRGFDPDDLTKSWQVSYCESDPTCSPAIYHRIIIPVYQPMEVVPATGEMADEILAGWQARAVGDDQPDSPKYLFAQHFRKSKALYGLIEAYRENGPVIICEGATDVWRLRNNAIALFGKACSRKQEMLIHEYFERRPLVVLLDRDAEDEAIELHDNLAHARYCAENPSPVVIAKVPDGFKDPGDCPRDQLMESIQAALGRAPKGGNMPRKDE